MSLPAEQQSVTIRNSPWLIPANLLRHARAIVVAVVALVASAMHLHGTWHFLVSTGSGLAVLSHLNEPIVQVIKQRLRVVDDQLRYSEGLIDHTERTLPLARVTTFEVDQPWYLRPFNLHAVTMAAQGMHSGAVTLAGVRGADIDRLTRLTAQQGLVPAGWTGRPQLRKRGSEPTSSARPSVHFRLKISNFELFATAANHSVTLVFFGLVLVEPLQRAGDLLLTIAGASHNTRVLVTVLVVLGFVVGVGLYGALRFWGFEISSEDARAYRVTYGALDRRSHTVLAGQVVAITLRASPLDALLGTERVSLSTAELARAPLGRVEFPSVRPKQARSLVLAVSGIDLNDVRRPRGRWWLCAPLVAILIPVAVVTLIPLSKLWIMIAVALATLLATLGGLRFFSGRVRAQSDGSSLAWSAVALHSQTHLLSPDCVRAVRLVRLPWLPVGSLTVDGFAAHSLTLRKFALGEDRYRQVRRVQDAWVPYDSPALGSSPKPVAPGQ